MTEICHIMFKNQIWQLPKPKPSSFPDGLSISTINSASLEIFGGTLKSTIQKPQSILHSARSLVSPSRTREQKERAKRRTRMTQVDPREAERRYTCRERRPPGNSPVPGRLSPSHFLIRNGRKVPRKRKEVALRGRGLYTT